MVIFDGRVATTRYYDRRDKMVLILVALLLAIVAITIVLVVRSGSASGNLSGSFRELKRMANLRGWHFSRPDGTRASYGLSGDAVLSTADGTSFDWRVRWHVRTSREAGKDKTEIKCADVPLRTGWVFIDPKSEQTAIRARQRMAATPSATDALRKTVWKEEQSHGKEVPVGSPEFLARYVVTATASESLTRRLLSKRVQKALLAIPDSDHVSVRLGAEGVVITSAAVFLVKRVEQLLNIADMLVAGAAEEVNDLVLA
jgi:hypothetical protein